MTKNDADLSRLSDSLALPAEPRPFAAAEMIRCDDCLRWNPPTRLACLYCGANLPFKEQHAARRLPAARPLEPGLQGFNCILLKGGNFSEDVIAEISGFTRYKESEVQRLLSSSVPMPLARSATLPESQLIEQRLNRLDVECITVADETLGLPRIPVQRLRAMEIDDGGFVVHPSAGEEKRVAWSDVALLITGRLCASQIAIKERKRRGAEKQIVDSIHTTSDEEVVDIYTLDKKEGWRILANNFDFSCLSEEKKLLAGENFRTLKQIIVNRSGNALHNDSYNTIRRQLDLVWPPEQQTSAGGWKRERAGKYSTSEVAITTNEPQFTRYSRLSQFLLKNNLRPNENAKNS